MSAALSCDRKIRPTKQDTQLGVISQEKYCLVKGTGAAIFTLVQNFSNEKTALHRSLFFPNVPLRNN